MPIQHTADPGGGEHWEYRISRNFESVGYHGRGERFFAKLSLYGTLAALAISLALGLL